ncbi:hypothetical protein SCP_0805010 [Sparassis crispa]|uniref:Uncharacterized protein n=1 Tax=Sparassis crispa TaxID=139825 RepID=A0A401GUS0_9APHY|nr:hypothetical protein SCP_0805010 [Sparassis crispa]GBE85977.1 hypothetical protein SCP_0805010 [Sparassis crispa]
MMGRINPKSKPQEAPALGLIPPSYYHVAPLTLPSSLQSLIPRSGATNACAEDECTDGTDFKLNSVIKFQVSRSPRLSMRDRLG